MEHAPSQPLMRDHCFHSPKPQLPLAELVGFFGSGCPAGYPAELITQSNSDWLILFEPILSIVDGAEVNGWLIIVNAPFRCNIEQPLAYTLGSAIR